MLRLMLTIGSLVVCSSANGDLLQPMRLEDVALTGEWKEAERRNQEVLLSLNMSSWACHFTTSANLTSCVPSTQWRGRPREASNCVAPGGKGKPACSPLPGEMGLGGYFGHYQGHWLSATAFLYNTTGNGTIKEAADNNVATLGAVMAAWEKRYPGPAGAGYLFPLDPMVWDLLLEGKGTRPFYSVPFYTLHKLMAGLLDQWQYARNEQAYTMVRKMAAWVRGRVERTIQTGGMALWQKVLLTEWGGMNDVLYNLYSHTKDPAHLATARRFNGYVFTAPLAAGDDDLSLLPFPHANFHLPEIVGNARAYEITGNTTDKAIVETFFSALTSNHSYATGGSNSGECWQAPRDLGNFLTDQTEESCTQYNVLKVARRSFLTSGSASLADFYETAILNGIVGNQNREGSGPGGSGATTSYIYMQPLGGANFKPWGLSNFGFPCCWGTLSESFAKLGDSIYFWQPRSASLYVNQFVSSSVSLSHALGMAQEGGGGGSGGVEVEQQATFPVHPNKTTTLKVRCAPPGASSVEFTLMLRVPGWATAATNAVTVNGVPVPAAQINPGAYIPLKRMWKDGDTVEASFPQTLRTEPLNDYHPEHNATLAFKYGPLVLAGVHLDSDIFVPRGGAAAAREDPSSFIKRNSSSELDFEAVAADGTKLRMIPLKDVLRERYVAYFMTAGTKPPQPPVVYCPHSQSAAGFNYTEAVDEKEQDLIMPTAAAAARGHGVGWRLDNGQWGAV